MGGRRLWLARPRRETGQKVTPQAELCCACRVLLGQYSSGLGPLHGAATVSTLPTSKRRMAEAFCVLSTPAGDHPTQTPHNPNHTHPSCMLSRRCTACFRLPPCLPLTQHPPPLPLPPSASPPSPLHPPSLPALLAGCAAQLQAHCVDDRGRQAGLPWP